MHGFLNVFAAACLAWQGARQADLAGILEETDISSLRFTDEGLIWRDSSVSTAEIASTRRDFAHSFGSCSLEEPVTELREAGLLP